MTIVPSSFHKPEKAPGAGQAGSRLWRAEVLKAAETKSDRKSELTLRPSSLEEYIGQSRLKALLTMSVKAALAREEPLDHLLLHGPPGLGKTTLANIIAAEMGARIHLATGPGLERPRDIIGLLHQLERGDVLFIDEIHRLNRVAEELLYPAMEDFAIDLTSGKGQATRTMRLPLPRFTLIGATTRAAMLSNALRDRFGLVQRLDFYSEQELEGIVRRTAALLGLDIAAAAVAVVAGRARGTPRIANRLVRLVRDFVQYRGETAATEELALAAMDTYQIDAFGLDPTDRQLLSVLLDSYGGGPVGVDTLAATIGEDADTLENVYEPYLIQRGLLQRTARGRMATPGTYAHLGRSCPPTQLNLNVGPGGADA